MKLAVVAVAITTVAAGCSSSKKDDNSGGTSGGKTTSAASSAAGGGGELKGMKIGIAFDIGGRGDHSFNDLAAKAGDAAKAQGAEVKEATPTTGEPDSAKIERLSTLADAGYNPIIAVGFVYAEEVQKVAKQYPDIKFANVDGFLDAPNLTNLVFSVNEASYLVGVAAALKTKTNKVGFVGGVKGPIIDPFGAGFEAGVKAANPKASVAIEFISDKADDSAFKNPSGGKTKAKALYDSGVDIVFAAAGASGDGVFAAAKAAGKLAIGVDSDQYQTVSPALRDVILTSSLKKVDVAVADFIKAAKAGTVKAGFRSYDLKNSGVGYATSGGKVDDIKTQIEAAAQKVISGELKVPTELK
jgi:basic membrane protein A and related proteins